MRGQCQIHLLLLSAGGQPGCCSVASEKALSQVGQMRRAVRTGWCVVLLGMTLDALVKSNSVFHHC